MKSLAKGWMEQAVYDLKTAEAMLKTGRYLYVAFMCQQAVEKILKGIICERTDKTPPYLHRLEALLRIANISVSQEKIAFLNLLTRYYINARYPEHKQKLAKGLNRKTAFALLKQTKEHFQCLKKELPT